METSIQILGPEDWESYKKIFLRGLQNDPAAFAVSYRQESLTSDEDWKKKILNPHRRLYGVKVKGELVAIAGIQFDHKEQLAHSAVLGPFLTDASHRNKGYGSLLLKKVLSDLKIRPDIRKVILYVNAPQEAAQRLYKKAGFQQVGLLKKETRVGEMYYDQAVMEILFEDKF